jgi:general stress protein YciG
MQTTMAKERSPQQDATNQAAETPPTRRKPGPKPGTEAARRGGTAAREKYGREFYSKIGAKGGSTVRERHGSTFYTEIGRRGGQSTKRNLGVEHYSRIGRIGGQRAHGQRDKNADVDTAHTDLGGSRAAE